MGWRALFSVVGNGGKLFRCDRRAVASEVNLVHVGRLKLDGGYIFRFRFFFMIRQVFKYPQCVVDKQHRKHIDSYQREKIDMERESVTQPSSAEIAEKQCP